MCCNMPFPGNWAPHSGQTRSDRIMVMAIVSPAPMEASDLADIPGVYWPAAKVLDAHPASRNNGLWGVYINSSAFQLVDIFNRCDVSVDEPFSIPWSLHLRKQIPFAKIAARYCHLLPLRMGRGSARLPIQTFRRSKRLQTGDVHSVHFTCKL